MKWLVLGVVASACVSSSSVICSDGRYCPTGTTCTAHDLCVTSDQTEACAMLVEGDACMVGTLAGHCQDGACLNPVCGDGFVEIGEMCDDHNTLADDGCSADCTSTESCGNGVIDAAFGEQCDDANFLDHDGCSSRCFIETPHWIEHSLLPPARQRMAAAYDPGRDRIVMFGGFVSGSGGKVFGDTWEFDGADWIHVPTPSAPVARTGAVMAFDIAHHDAVLFGGASGLATLSDTWTWDGSTWTPRFVVGPGPRVAMAMAYDAKRQRAVMFGGQALQPNGNPLELDETWEWDGAAWSKATPPHAPPKRLFAAMAFDPKRGVIVMTGGVELGVTFTDTWEYDGVDWTMKSSSAPQASESALAYDTSNQRMLVFDGSVGGALNILSAWNGTTWTPVVIAGSPSARSGHLMVQTASRIVVFGGQAGGTENNETWFLSGNVWTTAKDPGPRDGVGLVRDPVRARLVLYGGVTNKTGPVRAGDTWELTPTGYALRAAAPPVVRSLPCIAYDYAHHNIVMFGGTGAANSPIGETWVWDGGGWTQKFPQTIPPPRSDAACAFDGHHVTMVGGLVSLNGALGDAWSWDGTNWSSVTLPSDLGPRGGASAAYDPIRDQMVMFGGLAPNNNAFFVDETWLYDGTTWTRTATTGFRPGARYKGAMAWNPARQTVVMSGGIGTPDVLDAYEWDGAGWRLIDAINAPPGRGEHGATTSIDGGGILVYGGLDPKGLTLLTDRWELRWDAPQPFDRCNTADADGDHHVGCADPDCWWVCTPLCPPAPPMTSAATCDPAASKCGDGVCDPSRETCRNCPADCTCAPVCGDGFCDPGETCVGDCP